MDTDRGVGVVDGCSLRDDDGIDHISSLPDHLLHRILVRLPGGAADSVRTSVLSRRWPRVWAHLPDLLFRYNYDDEARLPSSSPFQYAAPDRVNAALAAYSAPTVRRLEITISYGPRQHLTAEHVSSWLRFSSRHLAGELRLAVPCFHADEEEEEQDILLLPVCERVTSIHFDLDWNILRFWPPTAAGGGGVFFKALETLRINEACVDGPGLEEMLSSRCPCLKKLELERVLVGGGASVLYLHSDSLEWLHIGISFHGRLQVAAPKLRTFHGSSVPREFFMAAPMLSELCSSLEIDANSLGLKLMRQFNVVDELDLTVYATQGIQQYKRFLEDTNKLARCEVLVIRCMKMEHSFKSAVLHLLRQRPRVRKLVVQLTYNMDDYPCKLFSECPCSLPENCKTKNMVLGLLEEVEIEDDHGEAHTTVELVRLLCKCSKIQKRVSIITISSEGTQNKYIGMNVRNIVSPNTKVEITVRRPAGVTSYFKAVNLVCQFFLRKHLVCQIRRDICSSFCQADDAIDHLQSRHRKDKARYIN